MFILLECRKPRILLREKGGTEVFEFSLGEIKLPIYPRRKIVDIGDMGYKVAKSLLFLGRKDAATISQFINNLSRIELRSLFLYFSPLRDHSLDQRD